MKKAVHFSAIIFLLLPSIGIFAEPISTATAPTEVNFKLTNKSSETVWINGEINHRSFTGRSINYPKKLSPGESFSTNISNGSMDLIISLIDPATKKSMFQKFRKYETAPTANNKDKILIWNHTGHPKEPLYPESSNVMGIFKTKQPNNITIQELLLYPPSNL